MEEKDKLKQRLSQKFSSKKSDDPKIRSFANLRTSGFFSPVQTTNQNVPSTANTTSAENRQTISPEESQKKLEIVQKTLLNILLILSCYLLVIIYATPRSLWKNQKTLKIYSPETGLVVKQ